MKVLVTGGAGFMGFAIASALAENGNEVTIYDIAPHSAELKNIECIKGDVFDACHLSDIIRRFDCVIHMVGLVGVAKAHAQPQASFDLNVRSLQVLLEVMRCNNISRLIIPSAAAVYGTTTKLPISEDTAARPTNTYGFHKYISEKVAETYSFNYGISTSILRVFNPFGLRGQGILNVLLESASKGKPVKLYTEKQKRDLIHISDVAEAFVRVLKLDHRFDVYNVGTGIGRRIDDIVHLIREYHPNLVVEHVDYAGVPYDSVADITKLKKATGFCPDGSTDTLRKFVQEWKSNL